MSTVQTAYRGILGPERTRVRAFVMIVASSTLMEGLALAALVPLLSGTDTFDVLSRSYRGSTIRSLALAAFAVAAVLSAILKYRSETVALQVLGSIERRLRATSTSLLLRMRWSEFLALRLGDVNTSVLLAANQIAIGAHFLVRAYGAIVATAILIAVSLVVAPVLSALVLAFAAIAAVAYRYGARRSERHARELTEHANSIGATVTDVLANLKYFQSSGSIEASEREMAKAYEDYATSWYQSQRYAPYTRMGFEIGATIVVVVVLGVVLAVKSRLTPEAVAAFAIFARTVPRITMAQEWFQLARLHRPWLDAWDRLVETARKNERGHPTGLSATFNRSLTMRDVEFTYPERDTPVLQDVSWTIGPGAFLGVAGESGAGKTTLLDLVTGLLTPTRGTVAIDGVPLTDVDLAAWQQRIGLVLQHSPLFHATVAENVRGAMPGLDRARVVECLRLANAYEFVDALPAGIDTVIGESGGRLSGGQRQRLALARALYRRPWLLVLDEPTAALDAESEQALVAALRALHGRCTVIVAAHRLTTIREADEILVLDSGRIVERGAYEDLARDPLSSLTRILTATGNDGENH